MKNGFEDNFTAKEKALWKQILVPTLEEFSKANPDASVLEGYYQCYEKYCLSKWCTGMKSKDFVLFTQEEYNQLPDTFGPDLTAIPTLRSSLQLKKVAKKPKTKMSSYNKFIKIYFAEHPQSSDKSDDRFNEAIQAWKNLTDEEKAKYEE